MENRYKSVSFSGHRKERIIGGDSENILRIRTALIISVTELYRQGYTVFYSGMANGFDLLAAEVVQTLRNYYKDIRLIAVVPFIGQSKYYDAKDKALYDSLLEGSDEVITLSSRYYRGCFLRRNDYMIQRSRKIIAFWDGNPKGGAYYTARKAAKNNIEFINLYNK